MKNLNFAPPYNKHSWICNFKKEFFSSCRKLRKMSWGEFGIFISQNYSWLRFMFSTHLNKGNTNKTQEHKKNFSIPTSGVFVRWNVSSLNVSAAESPPGVFLYLGYSKKDSIILTRGRMKIQDAKNIPRWQWEDICWYILGIWKTLLLPCWEKIPNNPVNFFDRPSYMITYKI